MHASDRLYLPSPRSNQLNGHLRLRPRLEGILQRVRRYAPPGSTIKIFLMPSYAVGKTDGTMEVTFDDTYTLASG